MDNNEWLLLDETEDNDDEDRIRKYRSAHRVSCFEPSRTKLWVRLEHDNYYLLKELLQDTPKRWTYIKLQLPVFHHDLYDWLAPTKKGALRELHLGCTRRDSGILLDVARLKESNIRFEYLTAWGIILMNPTDWSVLIELMLRAEWLKSIEIVGVPITEGTWQCLTHRRGVLAKNAAYLETLHLETNNIGSFFKASKSLRHVTIRDASRDDLIGMSDSKSKFQTLVFLGTKPDIATLSRVMRNNATTLVSVIIEAQIEPVDLITLADTVYTAFEKHPGDVALNGVCFSTFDIDTDDEEVMRFWEAAVDHAARVCAGKLCVLGDRAMPLGNSIQVRLNTLTVQSTEPGDVCMEDSEM